jgi:hypothetical protein
LEGGSDGAGSALSGGGAAFSNSIEAVRHQFHIYKSYRQVDEAIYYSNVTPDTVFAINSGGLTNITFTDQVKGMYLRQLVSFLDVAYGGDGIEKNVILRDAYGLIKQYFPNYILNGNFTDLDFKQYQNTDGGMSILPYAGSDLATTVKLIPYIRDDININSLKNYIYDAYEGKNVENRMCALYGLALLNEPVLLDLGNYSTIGGLSVTDMVYIALGYCALGEMEAASALYDSLIAPRLEKISAYYRVNTGADRNGILEATSSACALATNLDKPERGGLYQYCCDNYATDILIIIERLSYIKHEMAKTSDRSNEDCSISYTLFGEKLTKGLKDGGSFTLSIPAQSFGEFRLVEVEGSVGAVSVISKPVEATGETDNDVAIYRRYYKADDYENGGTAFEQGDLVRVQLWIDYSKKAIGGSYSITDYLPSGLQYVDDSAKIGDAPGFGAGYRRYCRREGQKVTFYDYNRMFDGGCLYYYYARIINPGVFIAEGPLVQNLEAKDSFAAGENSVISIN